ncbi:hypothetical protein MACH26_04250 [Planctobacterium marinum]|uniref:Uncharacterized protein n=1 Tax=Planctobacterium marinum TaxID=1631968 RepID=A0AA48HN45_9ALTE|nr:hypothetical protein MACH26_04250 [Planctobacterium marinum]
MIFAGTTLRTWVPQKQRWDLAFLSAQGGHYPNFFGKWHNDHMQIEVRNQDAQGEFLSKIRFKDITAESFTWDMYQSRDEGKSWSLDSIIKAHRVN